MNYKDVIKLRIGGLLGKRLVYSIKNSYKFKMNSIEYLYLNPLTVLKPFCLGSKYVLTLDQIYIKIQGMYSSSDETFFRFGEVLIPKPVTDNDKRTLALEFADLLAPYLCTMKSCLPLIYTEGPYEINDMVSISQNDCVVDCGANMGIFSAVASRKGAKVYSFEPNNYVIDNYLSITSSLNPNIHICKYALSNTHEYKKFTMNFSNIGSSSLTTHLSSKNTKEIDVECVTLDDFINEHNIKKVDFVKADIEGAERLMLKGAKNVLKDFKPKLAICTYHLPDDPIVLEECILDANPNYKVEHKYMKLYAY